MTIPLGSYDGGMSSVRVTDVQTLVRAPGVRGAVAGEAQNEGRQREEGAKDETRQKDGFHGS